MFGDILQPTHLLFVLVVALLVLGPKRLPEVARSLGDSLRDFRSAISGERQHDSPPLPEPADDHIAPEPPELQESQGPSTGAPAPVETRVPPAPNPPAERPGPTVPPHPSTESHGPIVPAQPAAESHAPPPESLGQDVPAAAPEPARSTDRPS